LQDNLTRCEDLGFLVVGNVPANLLPDDLKHRGPEYYSFEGHGEQVGLLIK
jgi:hypothetical protein